MAFITPHSFQLTLTVFTILSAFLLTPVNAFNNTIYIITNAETPSLRLPGLTPVGLARAQECIPAFFAPLNIGKIISCLPDRESHLCYQTVATATPVANALGLPIDTSCGADEETDDDCVYDLMRTYSKTSDQAILVVWDIDGMDDFLENIDADEPDEEDEDEDDDDTDDDDDDDDWDEDDWDEDVAAHYDIVTVVVNHIITDTVSQGCSGIDGQAPGTFRRSVKRSKTKRATKKSDLSRKRKEVALSSRRHLNNRMIKRRIPA